MKLPTHLSANNLKLWMGCKVEWNQRYGFGDDRPGGDAANLGSALHKALETYVEAGDHLRDAKKSGYDPTARPDGLIDTNSGLSLLWVHWTRAIAEYGIVGDQIAEGNTMIADWLARQDWSERTVLSTEMRHSFKLVLDDGTEVDYVYIIDRVDELPDGTVEVIDYKSGRWMLTPSQMRTNIQVLSYATATWLERPNQDLYWVTLDYLRDQPIGVGIRPSECSDFYDYLVSVAEEIRDTDPEDTKETVYEGCRFCVRNTYCQTLKEVGAKKLDLVGLKPGELAEHYLELNNAKAGIEAGLKRVSPILVQMFEQDDELPHIEGVFTKGKGVTVGSRSQRYVDMELVKDEVPAEVLAEFVKLGVGDLDKLIDSIEDDAVRKRLKKAYQRGRTRPSLKVVDVT